MAEPHPDDLALVGAPIRCQACEGRIMAYIAVTWETPPRLTITLPTTGWVRARRTDSMNLSGLCFTPWEGRLLRCVCNSWLPVGPSDLTDAISRASDSTVVWLQPIYMALGMSDEYRWP